MNSKKCENVMTSFFELDKGERLPFLDSVHLLMCRECRTKVRALSKAEKLMQNPLMEKSPFNSRSLSQAIRNSEPSWLENLKPVSMTRWVLSGLCMIVLLVFSGIFLEKVQNQEYLTWFFVIVGGAVTAYCAMFIAVNLDFFIKKSNAH